MRRIFIPFLIMAGACGGISTSGSLQGSGSFSPNASYADVPILEDGGIEQDLVVIGLINSSPVFTCGLQDAGPPDGGQFFAEVGIVIAQSGAIKPGTFEITDENTFFFGGAFTEAGMAIVALGGPTNPPGDELQTVSQSVSGTLTLAKSGTEWAGSFTAKMLAKDGGENSLSGSFDTGEVCYSANF